MPAPDPEWAFLGCPPPKLALNCAHSMTTLSRRQQGDMGWISIFTRLSAWDTRSVSHRGAASGAVWVSVWVIAFVFIFPVPPAYAYIDPGSGSILLQMILAGLASAAFYFRELITGVLRKILRRDRPANVTKESEPPQNPGPER